MAKKTHTLKVEEEYDFLLWSIFCSHRDYQICSELHQKLDLNFERLEDLEIKLEKKGSTGLFPIFHFMNSDEEHYFIISNKCQNGLFMPELKQVDYFLLIKNYSRYTGMEELTKKISKIENINSVMEMDPSKLKSADNFLMIEYS